VQGQLAVVCEMCRGAILMYFFLY